MLCSLFENNSEEAIEIYLLYGGLPKQSIEDLQAFLLKWKNSCLYSIFIPNEKFSMAPKQKWWSEEIYYRLLLPFLLEEERALWLDADIIVNGSLREFYTQDLGDAYAVVCKGSNQTFNKRLGLPEEYAYFNSGVILYNLARVKRDFTEENIFSLIKEYESNLKAPDQDILNIMFSKNLIYADEKIYNHETFGFSILSSGEMRTIRKEAKIIHFNGPIKPWDYKGVNWADRLWWKYERKRGRYLQYVGYRVRNLPIKIKVIAKEIYYMAKGALKKLGKGD